jgi:acyl-CoA oxidase
MVLSPPGFAMDLLRGRASVPLYRDHSSLLSRHERSLISFLKLSLASATNHRDGSIDTSVLPLCQALIEAIGARMAFEAACDRLPGEVMDLFLASTIRKDAAWYASNADLDGAAQARMEAEAARALLPRINILMDMLDIKPYVVAPIVSDEEWGYYVNSLEKYGEVPVVIRSVALSFTTRFVTHQLLFNSKL